MKITSTSFKNNERIPAKYTCDSPEGEGAPNPPLEIYDIPPMAKSLVLICDDPDAANGMWDHWIVFEIRITKDEKRNSYLVIEEGNEPEGIAGKNSWGRTGYGGPCPHKGIHRYFFKAYALDGTLGLGEGSRKEEIEKAMEGHIIAQAELVGLYERGR